jgi:hypothetical protein
MSVRSAGATLSRKAAADVEAGYFFDGKPLASSHGSLSYADASTPLAFAYPGATSGDRKEDTVLDAVRKPRLAGAGPPPKPPWRDALWRRRSI